MPEKLTRADGGVVSAMREWPIIFSPEMVRALLDGRKTQTRRLPTSMWANVAMHHADGVECRLWVQEAHAFRPVLPDDGAWRPFRYPNTVLYRCHGDNAPRWRPSIHMPRWASRITLRVTAIGLERLQDISETDALAEGSLEATNVPYIGSMTCDQAAQAFSLLWNTLHTKPGTRWGDNPEVYRIAFERIDLELPA